MCFGEKEKPYITQQLRQAKIQADTEIKLLLLGAGESGKSTIAKQLKIIHCEGFTTAELMVFKPLIYANTVSAMQAILAFCNESALRLSEAAQASASLVTTLRPGDTDLTPDLAVHFKTLWRDAAVREAYERRAEFQLIDSAKTFFDEVDRIASPDFVPTERDALTVRARTTGIIELEFTFMRVPYRLMDVGGQRSERKKWIHCFQDVKAILFVAALSGYNQMLFECVHRNRLLEAIELFDEICNTTWFRRTSIVLFLNKSDLFREKIEKQYELTECFPHFPGPLTYESALMFIRAEFLQRNRDPNKTIYPHVTCATDTKNVQTVFGAVADTILREQLSGLGLIT